TATVEDNVLPLLEGVEGLSDAQVSGQRIQKVSMTFDEAALAQYGLTPEKIQQLIQGSNLTFPLGLTEFGGEVKNLVIDGDITSVDDLQNLQIPAIPQAAQTPGAGAPEAPATPGNTPEAPGAAPETPAAPPSDTPAAPQTPAAAGLPTIALSELAEIEVVSEAESISRTNGEESIGVS